MLVPYHAYSTSAPKAEKPYHWANNNARDRPLARKQTRRPCDPKGGMPQNPSELATCLWIGSCNCNPAIGWCRPRAGLHVTRDLGAWIRPRTMVGVGVWDEWRHRWFVAMGGYSSSPPTGWGTNTSKSSCISITRMDHGWVERTSSRDATMLRARADHICRTTTVRCVQRRCVYGATTLKPPGRNIHTNGGHHTYIHVVVACCFTNIVTWWYSRTTLRHHVCPDACSNPTVPATDVFYFLHPDKKKINMTPH